MKKVLIVIGAATILTVIYTGESVIEAVMPPCMIWQWLGVYCPGCGSGRAAYQLLHGNLYAAFSFNPLFVLLLPVMLYLSLGHLLPAKLRRLMPDLPLETHHAWILIGTLLSYAVLRNLPWYPFCLLIPTSV